MYCYCHVLYVKDPGHTCMQNVVYAEIREQLCGASSLFLPLYSSLDQIYKSSGLRRARALTHKDTSLPPTFVLFFLKKKLKVSAVAVAAIEPPTEKRALRVSASGNATFMSWQLATTVLSYQVSG